MYVSVAITDKDNNLVNQILSYKINFFEQKYIFYHSTESIHFDAGLCRLEITIFYSEQ